MVDILNPAYEISDYLGKQHNILNGNIINRRSQLQDTACKTRRGSRQFKPYSQPIGDWKCESLNFLDGITESHFPTWREWYKAFACAIPTSTTIKESSGLEQKFADLTEQWQKETAHLSSTLTIAMHPAYQQIIGMGKPVLPLIFKRLIMGSGHWFWALSAITGENPVNPEDAGHVEKMREAWLSLGRERGWV